MLEFQLAKAKLNSCHSPVEFHGEDTRLACHVKFTTTQANDMLAMLHPSLRAMLFTQSDNKDLVGDGHLPKVRFPQMPLIAWEAEFSGVRLVVSSEFGAGSPIVLDECELKGIRLAPKEGGSVDIEFKVIGHPEAAQVGKLAELQQHDVLITVEQGAIREEQAKVDKRAAKDTKSGDLLAVGKTIPAPAGGWPFQTNWEAAHKKLTTAGYQVEEAEAQKWTTDEVNHVIAFCDALVGAKVGGSLPKAPAVLKERYVGEAPAKSR